MSKPIIDEQRAREIVELAKQMNEPSYELSPPWSEDEYTLISTLWKVFKANPGTNGKKIGLDMIRQFFAARDREIAELKRISLQTCEEFKKQIDSKSAEIERLKNNTAYL